MQKKKLQIWREIRNRGWQSKKKTLKKVGGTKILFGETLFFFCLFPLGQLKIFWLQLLVVARLSQLSGCKWNMTCSSSYHRSYTFMFLTHCGSLFSEIILLSSYHLSGRLLPTLWLEVKRDPSCKQTLTQVQMKLITSSDRSSLTLTQIQMKLIICSDRSTSC